MRAYTSSSFSRKNTLFIAYIYTEHKTRCVELHGVDGTTTTQCETVKRSGYLYDVIHNRRIGALRLRRRQRSTTCSIVIAKCDMFAGKRYFTGS